MTQTKRAKKPELAEKGTVLFSALRLINDKSDAHYMGNKNALLSNIDLTDEQADATDMYLLTPIPQATLEQQKERPQILAMQNYEQARAVAFTFALYMTGRFDIKKNLKLTVKQTLAPVMSSEQEAAVTMRFDKIGVMVITMNKEGGIVFDATSGVLLAESHVDTLTEDGQPYPQMIYAAVTPGCKVVEFKALASNTKFGPLHKREAVLRREAALEYQASLQEKEDGKA